jgi:hypothetical protein
MDTFISDNSLAEQMQAGTAQSGPVKLWVFHSHQKSCRYIFSDGSKADFVNGRYYTPEEGKARELTQQIVIHRSPYFFIKPGEETMMSDDLDPVVKLKKQLRAEIMQELYQEAIKITMGASNTTGDSVQGKLNAQSTKDIEAVAAGADQTTGARLAAIAQMVGVVPGKEADPVPSVTDNKLEALKAKLISIPKAE